MEDRVQQQPIFYTHCRHDHKPMAGFLTFAQDAVSKRKLCDIFRRPRTMVTVSEMRTLTYLVNRFRLFTVMEARIIGRVSLRKIDESQEPVILNPPLNASTGKPCANACERSVSSEPASIPENPANLSDEMIKRLDDGVNKMFGK